MSIKESLDIVREHDQNAGDGLWLEKITVEEGPQIREWDLSGCWHWKDWPAREKEFPGSESDDVGIDAVGQRRDGKWVAIQCKAKGRSSDGSRYKLKQDDITTFIATSIHTIWAERWIVTNAQESSAVEQITGPLQNNGIRVVPIGRALLTQSSSRS